MAISTYKVFLMKKADTGEQWSKLIDIKEFPDLGGEPEMLETTTLSDNMQTYIAGIQSLDGLSFTANNTLADFQTLKALEGKKVSYAVWFGGTESDGTVTPDGSNGKFSFDGELSVHTLKIIFYCYGQEVFCRIWLHDFFLSNVTVSLRNRCSIMFAVDCFYLL